MLSSDWITVNKRHEHSQEISPAPVMKCPFLTPTFVAAGCHDYTREVQSSLPLLCCPLLETKQTTTSEKSDSCSNPCSWFISL